MYIFEDGVKLIIQFHFEKKRKEKRKTRFCFTNFTDKMLTNLREHILI